MEDEDDFNYQGLPVLSRFPALGFLSGVRQKHGRTARAGRAADAAHLVAGAGDGPRPAPRTSCPGRSTAPGPVANTIHDVRPRDREARRGCGAGTRSRTERHPRMPSASGPPAGPITAGAPGVADADSARDARVGGRTAADRAAEPPADRSAHAAAPASWPSLRQLDVAAVAATSRPLHPRTAGPRSRPRDSGREGEPRSAMAWPSPAEPGHAASAGDQPPLPPIRGSTAVASEQRPPARQRGSAIRSGAVTAAPIDARRTIGCPDGPDAGPGRVAAGSADRRDEARRASSPERPSTAAEDSAGAPGSRLRRRGRRPASAYDRAGRDLRDRSPGSYYGSDQLAESLRDFNRGPDRTGRPATGGPARDPAARGTPLGRRLGRPGPSRTAFEPVPAGRRSRTTSALTAGPVGGTDRERLRTDRPGRVRDRASATDRPRRDARAVVHVVGPDETPRSIARDRLGDARRADEIVELNHDLLATEGRWRPGLRILLPPDARPERRTSLVASDEHREAARGPSPSRTPAGRRAAARAEPLPGIAGGHGDRDEIGQGEEQADRELDRRVARRRSRTRHSRHRPRRSSHPRTGTLSRARIAGSRIAGIANAAAGRSSPGGSGRRRRSGSSPGTIPGSPGRAAAPRDATSSWSRRSSVGLAVGHRSSPRRLGRRTRRRRRRVPGGRSRNASGRPIWNRFHWWNNRTRYRAMKTGNSQPTRNRLRNRG